MDWYKIINTKNGRSYIFNQKSISLMEQERLDLFLNKYDPQFEYDFKLKEDYTEIILKTKITEVEDV